MRKTVDALIDIIIIAIFIFTVLVSVEGVAVKYILTVVGSGAMFNNFKYLYDRKVRDNNKPKNQGGK